MRSRILCLLALAIAAPSASAAIALVNSPLDSGPGTLRAALASLPANGDHFVIFNLTPNATISLQSALPAIRGTTVFFDGLGAPNLTVRAVNGTRVFQVDPAAVTTRLTMRLFRIAGGVGSSGGCLFDPGSVSRTFVLDRMTFQDCRAAGSSFNFGGAVRVNGALEVADSNFIGNAAEGTGVQRNNGGAIYATAALSITGSRFVGNEVRGDAVAAYGAAIFASGALSIARSHFEGNRSLGFGFAIPGAVTCLLSPSCAVTATSFVGNVNGGLVLQPGSASITNSSFADTIDAPSLRVFLGDGPVRLRNLSFLRGPGSGSSSPAHLSVASELAPNPDIAVANTIFGSTGGAGASCSITNGLTGNGGGFVLAVDDSCTALANGLVTVVPDAGLLDPVDTGSNAPTQVLPLADASPARDLGSPALPGEHPDACLAADARGLPRPQDGDDDGVPVCDIGAWEAPTVRILADGFED